MFALLKTNQQADADADAADAACYRTPAKRRKLDVAKDCTPKMDCDPACDTPGMLTSLDHPFLFRSVLAVRSRCRVASAGAAGALCKSDSSPERKKNQRKGRRLAREWREHDMETINEHYEPPRRVPFSNPDEWAGSRRSRGSGLTFVEGSV